MGGPPSLFGLAVGGVRTPGVARARARSRVALAGRGAPAGAAEVNLAIGLPLRNESSLTALLQQLYDPASPNYHQWLTTRQFTEKFGPTEADYQALMRWAAARGLNVTVTHPNRVVLDVNGAVADIEAAFHVALRVPASNGNAHVLRA